MQTLRDFYDFMREVHTIRRAVVGYYLVDAHRPDHIRALEEALSALDNLPGDRFDKTLSAGGFATTVTLDYERTELEKDIVFLRSTGGPRDEFNDYLASHNAELGRTHAFASELDETVRFLRDTPITNFITDRDGTVNNYCGRYRSSHQSVWNAAYLSRFARQRTEEPVILTSAPLLNDGLLELTAMPTGSTHYAGSKGREYHSRDGAKGAMEIDEAKAAALDELNRRIDELVSRDEYRAFGVIGSGMQHKSGQTTVARQDIHGSIPDERSRAFLGEVRSLVDELDPGGTTFGVEDTGKDIEIMLTVEGQREFTKGDGIGFLEEALGLDLAKGPNLICGDTWSDLPMVERAAERSGPDDTAAIFVTEDAELRAAVARLVSRCHFVQAPDVLVAALHEAREDV
ncbi:MAG: trehalose 6-phosphate synthase [Spirochaetota bacterium]